LEHLQICGGHLPFFPVAATSICGSVDKSPPPPRFPVAPLVFSGCPREPTTATRCTKGCTTLLEQLLFCSTDVFSLVCAYQLFADAELLNCWSRSNWLIRYHDLYIDLNIYMVAAHRCKL
jgi:hypothetical protein